jgi:16S rRNA (cytosine1402-N4)-methyltransferase
VGLAPNETVGLAPNSLVNAIHIPVLGSEVVAALAVHPGGSYIDCTVGEGGHTAMLLGAPNPALRVLGIDLDEDALGRARASLADFGDAVSFAHGSYVDMKALAVEAQMYGADGVLMDLGLSSLQLETGERGFSFRAEARLDMRFDRSQAQTAWDVVNRGQERTLADLIYRLGEEPKSRRIASAIVRARPVETTTELAEIVARATGGKRGRIHPATRTFQAIRMAVNEELENIEAGLEGAVQTLKPGGRLAVISYHSLEDRAVKGFFRRESRDCICQPEVLSCECGHEASLRRVNKKVIKPTRQEIEANPRARSARLRVAERAGTLAGTLDK